MQYYLEKTATTYVNNAAVFMYNYIKWFRASSDLKSRETALLEAHYSDSKIQLLQQELASINNSLQAYQDER